MSFNICSISGSVASHPVISIKSGHIFEKRLIQRMIEATGKCPITNEPLSLDDLLEVKSNLNKEPNNTTNITMPGIINSIHSDWEALTAELAKNKSELDISKQALSHCLYKYDASCRVICKLTRERDLVREEINNIKNQLENQAEEYSEADIANE